jgi:hypothetical protein
VRSIGTEANTARTEARVRVTGASNASCINWTGVEGTKSLIGQKGKGKALLRDLSVGAREDKLLSSLSGRDFIHDKRLFRCGRNSVLRLPLPFLPPLLFNNCKEGKLF